MKKLFILLTGLFFLTGCPNEQEVEEMSNDLMQKKTQAQDVINASDYSLEGLLSAQEYFFDFGERVHLMKEDEKARASIKAAIKKKGMKNFCKDYVVTASSWRYLEDYCASSDIYKCSLDIKEYESTQAKFLELIGSEYTKQFNKEQECN